MSPMAPNQQIRANDGQSSSEGRSTSPRAWPTRPGSTAPHLQIPHAPTMDEIEDAFTEGGVASAVCQMEQLNSNNLRSPLRYGDAVAIAVEESGCSSDTLEVNSNNMQTASDTAVPNNGDCSVQQQAVLLEQSAAYGIALPSHFMGYMDEQGVIHKDKFDSQLSLAEQEDSERVLEEKKAAFTSKRSTKAAICEEEEEKMEILTSAEDILQASLNFERSHPEKRFSSSLDQYYSSSVRNLYPSLEDVGEPPYAQQETSTRQESIDSVRTTCADVVASAASAAASGASTDGSIVPEPPGMEETYAIASATCEAVDVEEDVKIGVARAELDRADTDSPAYAVASVDNNMAFASAEATVLGTSETPEERLLAKMEAEDAELVALKRSAYGGAYDSSGFVAQAAAFPDQQATVVSITEHDVHPSEISHGAVRAELIGEDYNDVPVIGAPSRVGTSNAVTTSACAGSAAASHVASFPSTSQPVFDAEEPTYAVVESEATVIDGRSTWQAEEATVLNEESSVPYSERKLPAVATVESEQQSTPQRNNRFAQTAEYCASVPAAATAAAAAAAAESEAEVITVSGDPYCDATYAHAEGEASSIAYADSAPDYGNAAVAYTDDAVSSVAYADGSVDYSNPSSVAYAEGTEAYGNISSVACAEDQAEVVGIAEEYHPAEVTGDEAQAELVGAAAFPGDTLNDQAAVVEITEEFHPAEVVGKEAQAEVISSDDGGEQAQVVDITEDFHPAEVAGSEAKAELVGVAQPADEGDGIQAATVLGYEDDESHVYSSPRASSYGGPIPDRTPPSTRAFTAPAAVGTRIDPVNTPLTQATAELDTVVEEDWMRTPSLAGDSEGHGVVVMKPPMDGDDEQPAVAVAAIEAYAEAPAPVAENTSCCSPAGYSNSQPAVAVASLNAYADAPAPPSFDDTDCSMVNRRAMQPEIVAGPSTIDASETSAANAPANAPAMPPPRSFHSTTSDGGSVGSTASVSTANTRGTGFSKISNTFSRGIEMLFGDKPSNKTQSDSTSVAKTVMSRQLLPWSVIYSEATNMWVATVNTNQKALDSKNVVEASKSLRAFSVVTEKQATCLAKAWSPPRMHDFKKKNACHICKAKFAVFRRACHCRNCGVAICVSSNGCSRPWPAKMCPETYNIKKESFLNVCAACDFLCTSFRLALLEGNRDKAIALHATGNINIVTPFANVKGELFYPVHCAALGGNLELLKWLVDENCCPIKSVRVSGRCRDSSNSFTEISTSKGRSLLGIALENRNVGIVRYLIVEKGIQLSGEKDITMDTLCRNLELVLRLLPEDAATGNSSDPVMHAVHHEVLSNEQAPPCDTDTNVRGMDTASDGSVSDACIICFDRSIDCVATPCGHQVCCLDCSKNITRCPVCAVECSFMRVFRP